MDEFVSMKRAVELSGIPYTTLRRRIDKGRVYGVWFGERDLRVFLPSLQAEMKRVGRQVSVSQE
jgi:hypothetical protein